MGSEGTGLKVGLGMDGEQVRRYLRKRLFQNSAYFCQKDILMLIEISDQVVAQSGLSKSDILLELALVLYQRDTLSLGLAAQMAGLHRYAFQLELGKRNIPVNIAWEDVQQDISDIKAAQTFSN